MKTHLLTLVLILHSLSTAAQEWKNYVNGERVTAIALHNDTVWVGTTGGLVKFLNNGTKLASYNHTNGLPLNDVIDVEIDTAGNKWIATNGHDNSGGYGGGVTKFDGTTWTTYDAMNNALHSTDIKGIAIDKQNRLWVSVSGHGIARFDGTNWVYYNTQNSSLSSDWLYAPVIDRNGSVWFACYNSSSEIVNIVGNNWAFHSRGNGVLYGLMAFDSQNNLWMKWNHSYLTQPGLAKYDGINWTKMSGWTFNVGIFYIDDLDSIWIGGGPKLATYDGVTENTYVSPVTGLMIQNPLVIDQYNTKWFGAYRKHPAIGLGSWDGTNWEMYETSDCGLPSNSIHSFAADKHGNKWIGSFDDTVGMVKFDGTNWDRILTITPENSMVDKDGIVWFTYYSNLHTYDGTNLNTIPQPEPFASSVTCIAEDKQGDKWFGTGSYGLFRFNGNSWVKYSSGIIDSTVFSIKADHQGTMWFATQGGVFKFDGNSWTNYTTTNSGLVSNVIYEVDVDSSNRKWFATDNGIAVFNDTVWQSYTTQNSGLPGNEVRSLAVDKEQNVWMACYTPDIYKYHGVTKFDGTNWTTYNTFNSGLQANRIYDIVVDDLDNKWFTSKHGISELTGTTYPFKVWAQRRGNICDTNLVTLNPVVHNGTPPFTYLWQSTGNNLSCSTCPNPTINITQNSEVTVLVTDSNNNTVADTLQLYACTYTGVGKAEATNLNVHLYPNPGNNLLFIESSLTILHVSLYSIDGRAVLKTGKLNGNAVDITNLNEGVYIAEIKTNEGTAIKKWVKH